MPDFEIARLISTMSSFTCDMCGKSIFSKMYEYKPTSYIPRYKPRHFKKMCGKFIYMEVYGSKMYLIRKKQGTLDGNV